MTETILAALTPAAMLALAVARGPADLRRASFRWFIPLVLLLLAPSWMTGRTPAPLDYLAGNVVPWKQPGVVVSNALQSDIVMQILPWREVVTRAWLRGEFPIENPFAGSGSPLWANPQAAVLYPLTFLGLPFSTFAWPIFAGVAKLLIAASGMFIFLRREGRSEDAAVFGAVAFAFGTFTIAFLAYPMTNVTVLLPWLLVSIGMHGWSGVVASSVTTALALSGGHPQSVAILAMLAIPYALLARNGVLRHAWAATIGFLLAAPVVVPFLMLMPLTARATHPLPFEPFALWKLAAFVFPAKFGYTPFVVPGVNFSEVATPYVGLAALILALFAMITEPRRSRFWIGAAIASLLITFLPLPSGALQLGRARMVTGFVTAVLAASGFDLAVERAGRRTLRVVAVIASAVAVILAIGSWRKVFEIGLGPLVVVSAAAAVATAVVLCAAPRRVWTAILFADLAVLAIASMPPHRRSEFFAETGAIRFLRQAPGNFRISGVGGSLFPNTSAMVGIADIRVHDPMAVESYVQTLERGGLDRRGYFWVFRGFPARPLANALGVRYIVAPAGSRSPLPVVYGGSDATIFLNATAAEVEVRRPVKPRGWRAGWALGVTGIMLLLHAVWLSAITRSSSAPAG